MRVFWYRIRPNKPEDAYKMAPGKLPNNVAEDVPEQFAQMLLAVWPNMRLKPWSLNPTHYMNYPSD